MHATRIPRVVVPYIPIRALWLATARDDRKLHVMKVASRQRLRARGTADGCVDEKVGCHRTRSLKTLARAPHGCRAILRGKGASEELILIVGEQEYDVR